MIVTVSNVKGGVGKSMIAVNLAVGLALEGQNTLLVDGDRQGTSLAFTAIRRAEKPDAAQYTAVHLTGSALRTQIRQRLTDRYDQIVVDVGATDSDTMRAAYTVTDLLIIPVGPRSFDLWALQQTLGVVREVREVHKLRALAVLNAGDYTGNRNQEALEALRRIDDVEVSPHVLVRRAAYHSAADEGLGVLEYRPCQSKAHEEFTAFFKTIYPKLERRKLFL